MKRLLKKWNVWLILFWLCILGIAKGESKNASSYRNVDVMVFEDTLLIVAFGNSITAERVTVNHVFAQRLPTLLRKKGIQSRVINAGIPGSHTGSINDHDLFQIQHGKDRFESNVLAYNPDLVLIGFGTNDSYIDSKVKKGLSRIPIKDYQNNLEYFVTKLIAVDARIILIAPNILGSNFPDFQNKRLRRYVKVVRKLARKYHTGLVDNYKLFQDYERKNNESFDTLMLDGCHPNDKGHKLIAHELALEIYRIKKEVK